MEPQPIPAVEEQPLSLRQRAILEFIQRYIEREGHAPSHRDIALGVSLTSTSVVAYHLKRLVAAGYLGKPSKHARSMVLCDRAYADLGKTRSGQPLAATANDIIPQLRQDNMQLRQQNARLSREVERLKTNQPRRGLLIKENRQLRKRNTELQERCQRLRQRVEALESELGRGLYPIRPSSRLGKKLSRAVKTSQQ